MESECCTFGSEGEKSETKHDNFDSLRRRFSLNIEKFVYIRGQNKIEILRIGMLVTDRYTEKEYLN